MTLYDLLLAILIVMAATLGLMALIHYTMSKRLTGPPRYRVTVTSKFMGGRRTFAADLPAEDVLEAVRLTLGPEHPLCSQVETMLESCPEQIRMKHDDDGEVHVERA